MGQQKESRGSEKLEELPSRPPLETCIVMDQFGWADQLLNRAVKALRTPPLSRVVERDPTLSRALAMAIPLDPQRLTQHQGFAQVSAHPVDPERSQSIPFAGCRWRPFGHRNLDIIHISAHGTSLRAAEPTSSFWVAC